MKSRTVVPEVNLSAKEKSAALRELTKGAEDVFAAHTTTGHEDQPTRWRPVYTKLQDRHIMRHLSGQLEIGSYPLIPDTQWPRCYWILVDFDGKKGGIDWKSDVQRAVEFLMDFDGCPCFVNLSRSGEGAHVRMLFKESVPAWLARRWLTAWLEEADIIQNDWEEVPGSFDRLIPPQDTLSGQLTRDGQRRPGNLAGSPLHLGHARRNGGTLPLNTAEVARGNFEPDGRHWEHLMSALEQRAWGEKELYAALRDCPGNLSTGAPAHRWGGSDRYSTPTVHAGGPKQLGYMVLMCEFAREMQRPGSQSYPLWVALATQLHRFGDDGRLDARYDARRVDQKWEQTAQMLPVRCDSLVHMGYRCPHLGTQRCNGSKAPTFFADHTDAEIL
jgi:hypothetical protein